MSINKKDLAISELNEFFSNRLSIKRSELFQFYLSKNSSLSKKYFRRILYSLQKEKVILSIGVGLYALLDSSSKIAKKKYIPNLSENAEELVSIVHEEFPYIHYLVWETNVLHEFMIHQPSQNQIILEVDKEVDESVFNCLKEKLYRNVFLAPDRLSFERYIINMPESILILRLITQSPKITKGNFITARLEKILVDIFADEEHFFVFHGQEMINIFENIFSMYWINFKTLFRYAGRRKVEKEMKEFLVTKIYMDLSKL